MLLPPHYGSYGKAANGTPTRKHKVSCIAYPQPRLLVNNEKNRRGRMMPHCRHGRCTVIIAEFNLELAEMVENLFLVFLGLLLVPVLGRRVRAGLAITSRSVCVRGTGIPCVGGRNPFVDPSDTWRTITRCVKRGFRSRRKSREGFGRRARYRSCVSSPRRRPGLRWRREAMVHHRCDRHQAGFRHGWA